MTDAPFAFSKDEYSKLSRNASVGVDGYLMVFSISSRNSFERINQINENLRNSFGEVVHIPRVLVGTMRDFPDQRQVGFRVSSNLTFGNL